MFYLFIQNLRDLVFFLFLFIIHFYLVNILFFKYLFFLIICFSLGIYFKIFEFRLCLREKYLFHLSSFPFFLQTVISLRSALDSSREELRRLKEDFGEFSAENYANVVERLALENHILRRKILSRSDFSSDAATSPPPHAVMIKQWVSQILSNQVPSIGKIDKKHNPQNIRDFYLYFQKKTDNTKQFYSSTFFY